MDLRKCTTFDNISSVAISPLNFSDKVLPKVQSKELEPTRDANDAVAADVDVDLREIYFLIMHFLSAGPCQKTSMQFWNELMEHQLLPKRYHAWYSRNGALSGDEADDGISFPLTYECVAQRYSHIGKDHLVKLLKQLILNVAPSHGIAGRKSPSAADVPTLLGIGPFSLLRCTEKEVNSQVKPLPAFLRWPHMQADQVRGIALREIGGGFPKHHRAPSIRLASYAIAKPSMMVQKMQNMKKLRGHRDAVYCAIFDCTGRYVITGSDDRLVKIWSMETAFCLASCRGHEGDITDLAVNLNNTLVASASNDYSIRVWRLPDGMPVSVLRGHEGAVTAIAFSPRHNFQLLSSSDDGTCRIWDPRNSKCSPRIYLPSRPDVSSGHGSGHTPSNGPSSSNAVQNHQILCCAYNANGTVFVTGSSDTFARVWSAFKFSTEGSVQPSHEIDILVGHENDVNYVQFSGCAAASRSLTSDSLTDEKIPKFKNSWYSHDNIVTCSRDGSAIIWIPRSRRSHGKVGRWTRSYHLKVPPPPMPPQPRRGGPRQRFLPTPRGVNMIVWSLDNRFVLAAIMDCRICVWNAADGSLVHSLTGHTESTYVLDVHPFNPRIAMSAGYDGKTIIWDIWEGIPIRTYEIGRFKLVDGKFSPDGTSIVLSDDVGQIYLLNTGQGESQKDSKYDQFFLGDYRPLVRDTHGNVLDQETQLVPYQRNIQDQLCDSSMFPYPEPYQSMYQRRRLGALNLEWRPPSAKLAIGTDIDFGQEYQLLPLADLDLVAEPLPDFIDAMYWEPENDPRNDTTDSEYNVTDEYSSEDEQGSSGNSSSDSDCSGLNDKVEGSNRESRARSIRKVPKAEGELVSSRKHTNKRNLNDQDVVSSRNKRAKKPRNGGNTLKRTSSHAKSSRLQRVSARNVRRSFSQITKSSSGEDDFSESESLSEYSCIQHGEPDGRQRHSRGDKSALDDDTSAATNPTLIPLVTNTEHKKRLILKFSTRDSKKSVASENLENKCDTQTNLDTSISKLGEEGTERNSIGMSSWDLCSTSTNVVDGSVVKNQSAELKENPRPKPTKIRIKQMMSTGDLIGPSKAKLISDFNASTSGRGDLVPEIPPGMDQNLVLARSEGDACFSARPSSLQRESVMSREMDGVINGNSKSLKIRFKSEGDGELVENTSNARNHDDETALGFSEAATDATRRTRSLGMKASSRETNDTNQNHKIRLRLGTSRGAEKSAKNAVKHFPPQESTSNSNMIARSGYPTDNGDNLMGNEGGASAGSKSSYAVRKMNWLLLSEQDEGCRYIPQLGDEVIYLRQGHEEYIESNHLPESGPWMSFREKIRDVELCVVEDLNYANYAGSGESCCKLLLRFIDSSSNVLGQRFKLTLPELINFPDFLVEGTRYDASIHRCWSPGDKCSVWWRNSDDGGGNWWEGRILYMEDKSEMFPGSPWERYHVKYDAEEKPYPHSPWELHDKDNKWEQPHIDPDSRERMLGSFAVLQSNKNQEKYGIRKLKQIAERLDFINRFPVPLTLDIIEMRLVNNYYRSLEAMRHDIRVMLTNVETYFAKNEELSSKMRALRRWCSRLLEL